MLKGLFGHYNKLYRTCNIKQVVLCEHPYSSVSCNILKLYLSFLELGKVLIQNTSCTNFLLNKTSFNIAYLFTFHCVNTLIPCYIKLLSHDLGLWPFKFPYFKQSHME